MWDKAIANTGYPVANAFLGNRVLPYWGSGFEKVSALLTVRSSLKAQTNPHTLLFLVPAARETTARLILTGLLVGDLAHSGSKSKLPPDELGHLFKGDVLFVTPSATPAKVELEKHELGGRCVLKDLWTVQVYSKYSRQGSASKPRVFVANPGWLSHKFARHEKFGAVVIDASHPRTLSRLPELSAVASRASDFRVIVAPPLDMAMLKRLGYPTSAAAWLWDPQALSDCDALTDTTAVVDSGSHDRTLWLCDEDEEIALLLQSTQRQLLDILRKPNGAQVPGLLFAWGIVNRLRQLTVPLSYLEEFSAQAYAGSIRSRIEILARTNGYGNPIWETTWPTIRGLIDTTYSAFKKRAEPAKFWVLANRIDAWLKRHEHEERLRVVVASREESILLKKLLEDCVDNVDEAVFSGLLEIMSVSEEAKYVAEGRYARTILAGTRSSKMRYLDVYPPNPVEVLTYPFEAETEQVTQRAMYQSLRPLQTDSDKMSLLRSIGFTSSLIGGRPTGSAAPEILCKRGDGRAVTLVCNAGVSANLDIEQLASSEGLSSTAEADLDLVRSVHSGYTGAKAVVSFEEGFQQEYPIDCRLDVFFPETADIHRIEAQNIQIGHYVISFVDGKYDGLFERVREAVRKELPRAESIALEVWDQAKLTLLSRHKRNREAIYHELLLDGIGSNESTVYSWFRDESGIIAPQQLDEFLIVAKATGLYPTVALMKRTFEYIRHDRGRSRAIGRALQSLLRAITSRVDYEEALESARKINTSLGDLLAAVEVSKVTDIRYQV